MGYRVEYATGQKKQKGRRRIIPLTLTAFFVFLYLVNTYWPEGQAVLTKHLPTGLKEITSAFTAFEWELRAGEDFLEAAQTFCQEVFQGAKLYLH